MRIEEARRTCVVSIRPHSNAKCGKPRWGWTNFMEPLCKEHFQQRRFIQNLLVMLSGLGSWGALVVHNNPEGFKAYVDD